jgi:hypothetical protein
MIDLFEKDASMLKKFTKALSSSCIKVANAQSTMISATQELSYYLRLYGQQKFPLDVSNNEESNSRSVASDLSKFAYFIDEVRINFMFFSNIFIVLQYLSILRFQLVYKYFQLN